MEYNVFRHIDALEYASAWESCAGLDIPAIEAKAVALNDRMKEIESSGRPVPTYLLAAYRGYENAILFRTHMHLFNRNEPVLVKLSDLG